MGETTMVYLKMSTMTTFVPFMISCALHRLRRIRQSWGKRRQAGRTAVGTGSRMERERT
jgi:hypothetical protein